MATTPELYYEMFVRDNYWDFAVDQGNIRKAFNACVPAFQMAEVYLKHYLRRDPAVVAAWPTKKHLPQLHAYLGEKEPGFVTVQSVATVYKHLYLDRAQAFYDVSSPGAIERVRSTKTGVEVGNPGDDDSTVEVRRKDGTRVLLIDCLRPVVEKLWPELLFPEAPA